MSEVSGHEPAPQDSGGPDVADLVEQDVLMYLGDSAEAGLIARDIRERKAAGIQKYGKPLRAFNGRNTAMDVYQELLDGVNYMRQMLLERTSKGPHGRHPVMVDQYKKLIEMLSFWRQEAKVLEFEMAARAKLERRS